MRGPRGGLSFCCGEGFEGRLFLVYFVNALTTFAWRPSGSALTLRVRHHTFNHYNNERSQRGPRIFFVEEGFERGSRAPLIPFFSSLTRTGGLPGRSRSHTRFAPKQKNLRKYFHAGSTVLILNSPLGPKGRFHKAKRLKELSILNSHLV